MEVEDLRQVLSQLEKDGKVQGKIGVLGVSYGANLSLLWAAADKRIASVVAVAPFNKPEVAILRFAHEFKVPISDPDIQGGATRAAELMGVRWDDLTLEPVMRKVSVPILFMSGGRDRVCPPDEIEKLIAAGAPGTESAHSELANHSIMGFCLSDWPALLDKWYGKTLR